MDHAVSMFDRLILVIGVWERPMLRPSLGHYVFNLEPLRHMLDLGFICSQLSFNTLKHHSQSPTCQP